MCKKEDSYQIHIRSGKQLDDKMDNYSSEYFIPIKYYPLGTYLKCNNSTITNGVVNVYNKYVR